MAPVRRNRGGQRRYSDADLVALRRLAERTPDYEETAPDLLPPTPEPQVRAWADLEGGPLVLASTARDDHGQPLGVGLPRCPYCSRPVQLLTVRQESQWVCHQHGQVPALVPADFPFHRYLAPPPRSPAFEPAALAPALANPYEMPE